MNAPVQQPIWWNDCPPQEFGDGPLPSKADVVVVGGGYSGLAAAHTLAHAGASVVVLDAAAFGHFASARNSGGVSFGLELEALNFYRRWMKLQGADVSALAAESAQAVDDLAAFVDAEGIDCDFRMAGRLVAASSPRSFDTFQKRADTLNRLFGADAQVLERGQQHEEIGAPGFHGVMVIRKSGQLHPAKLLHGLVQRCVGAGARLHSSVRVQALERSATGFVVRTDRGQLGCDRVILATNAHLNTLGRAGLERRVVPVASNIVVTEELPAHTLRELLPRGRTGSDGRKVLAYFRITPDGKRFLYGGRAAPGEVATERAASILRSRMVRAFPSLANARIAYTWGCQVAFTLDRIPHTGESRGVHFIAGCHGNGVAMMNHLGRQVARRLLGGPASAFERNDFPAIPLYRGSPWFLPAMHRTYQFLDWKAQR